MAESYFEYVLLQCLISSIDTVCRVDSTIEALKERASKGFNGCRNIIDDCRMNKSVLGILQKTTIIDPKRLDDDAKTIYERCKDFFLENCEKEYERYFDHLVDINWILASIQNAKETKQRHVTLLTDPSKISHAIKSYLFELYISAEHDKNKSDYIADALQARKKPFSGLSYHYEESRKYLSQDYSNYELEQMESNYRNNSICKMTLFYELTATAALAENIRRFC